MIIELRLDLLIDGKQHRWFPWRFRQSVDELQEFDYDEPGDNNNTTFSALPVGEVDAIQFLLTRAVDAIGLRVEGGEAGSTAIRMSENGLVLMMNVTLTDSNITVNVNSANDARVQGLGAGT
jgi:hypothetical protein